MFMLARNLVRSRPGRALVALRDNQTSASVNGVNLPLYKALAFGVSATFGGVAGSMLMIEPAVRVRHPVRSAPRDLPRRRRSSLGGAGTISGRHPRRDDLRLRPLLRHAVDADQTGMPPGLKQITAPLFDWLAGRPGGGAISGVFFGVGLLLFVFLLPGGCIAGFRRLHSSLRAGRYRTRRGWPTVAAETGATIEIAEPSAPRRRRPDLTCRPTYQQQHRGMHHEETGAGSSPSPSPSQPRSFWRHVAATTTTARARPRPHRSRGRRHRHHGRRQRRRPRRQPTTTAAASADDEGRRRRRPTAGSADIRAALDLTRTCTKGPSDFKIDPTQCPADWNPKQGITDTRSTCSSACPKSGPLAGFGLLADGMQSYFNYVNDNGGIDGSKITLDVKDDAYAAGQDQDQRRRGPRRQQVRRLAGVLGTPNNLGVWDDTNDECMPQLLNGTVPRSGVTSRTTRGPPACSSTTSPRPACGPSG